MEKRIAPASDDPSAGPEQRTDSGAKSRFSLRAQAFLALSTAVLLPLLLLSLAAYGLLRDLERRAGAGPGIGGEAAGFLLLAVIIGATGVLMAAVVASIASKRAAGPIRDLIRRSRGLLALSPVTAEQGDTGPMSRTAVGEAVTPRAPSRLAPAEVRELAGVFDRMAARLERSHRGLRRTLDERDAALRDLSAIREELERRVEERTAEAKSRAAVLEAVGYSARILFEKGWEPAATEALERLGTAVGADRVYLSEARLVDGLLRLARLYEWTAPGCAAVLKEPELQGIPVEEPGPTSWEPRLRQGEIVLGTVRELPPEERPPLERHGALSLLAAPIRSGGELWGILGVEDCSAPRTWSTALVEAFRAAANSLGAAISRERAEEAVRRSETHFRELFQHGFGLICTHALDGEVLSINPAAADALGWAPEEIVGRNLRDLLVARVRSQLPDYLRRLARAGRDEGTMIVTARDGENRYWHYRNRVLTRPGNPPLVLGYALDVTEQRRMQKALSESETRYRELFEQSFAIVCAHRLDGEILSINPAGAEALGYSVEELVGRRLTGLIPEPNRGGFLDGLRRLPERGTGEGLLSIRDHNGELRHFLFRHRWVSEASPPYVLAHALDVTERRRAEQALEHLALHDPLTGCANRALFHDRLEQQIAHSRRSAARGDEEIRFAVFFLDLDDFKPINDTFGHETGDEVLREVARRLREEARSIDTVARLGGDEFVLVLPGVRDLEEARRLADRLLSSTAHPIRHRHEEITIGISLGIALYPEDGETMEDLLRRADAAMYAAKQEGQEGRAEA